EEGAAGAWLLPGLALFLAIALHKPADALAISTVLTRKGVSGSKVRLVQIGFALMVPIGAAAFMLTRGAIEKDMQNQLTGAALPFPAGSSLSTSFSDFFPEAHSHRHDRVPLFLALVAGVLFMGGIALLEPHEHDEHEHGDHPAAGAHRGEHGDHPGDGAHRDHGEDDPDRD